MNKKTWAWPRPLPRSLAAALAFVLALLATNGQAETPFKLEMPLRCVVGESCWVVNYVDVDPSPGRRDYRCGWLSYDGHKGTDIAIADLRAMARGVAVVAAAGGRVMGIRDGMQDVNVKKIGGPEALKGKDCGNGVLIKHARGWSSQYCHMRKGSIAVAKGDTVTAGQRLGLVGLSGRTEFPHIHITVRKDGKVVDPFVGLRRAGRCSLGDDPLWQAEVLAKLDYRSVHLSNAGFAADKPKTESVRNGLYQGKAISRQSPALFLWVDVFWPRPGDEITFIFIAPNGKTIFTRKTIVEHKRSRGVFHAWIRTKRLPWPKGIYRGEISLLRKKGPRGREEYTVSRKVSLR